MVLYSLNIMIWYFQFIPLNNLQYDFDFQINEERNFPNPLVGPKWNTISLLEFEWYHPVRGLRTVIIPCSIPKLDFFFSNAHFQLPHGKCKSSTHKPPLTSTKNAIHKSPQGCNSFYTASDHQQQLSQFLLDMPYAKHESTKLHILTGTEFERS